MGSKRVPQEPKNLSNLILIFEDGTTLDLVEVTGVAMALTYPDKTKWQIHAEVTNE